jgi:hypothetical protein
VKKAAGPLVEAEAALVEHYPRLVRLAYLALPGPLGRHGRVLAAHRAVQRSMAAAAQVLEPGEPAYEVLRAEVLRAALAGPARLRGVLEAAGPPLVLGLRLRPRAGSEDQALGALPGPTRAAYALLGAEGLDEATARTVLDEAGAPDPRGAVRAAAELRLPGAAEFDPCTVRLGPTDLLRRRQRRRAGLAAAVAVALGAGLLALTGGGGGPEPYGAAGSPDSAKALDPAAVVRVAPSAWTATGRLDFTVWPARGARAGDTGLLRRALRVWAGPGASVQVSATPGTARTGPAQPPQLLYAGDVDKATVVIFYDGRRLVRYAEARGSGGGAAALDFAQVPGADAATAAAVVLDRVDGNTRFLTAPWISAARSRDLLAPDQPSAALPTAADGTTAPVRMPGAGAAAGSCGKDWQALQLRTSPKLGAAQSFLLTDLGDLSPVHLTSGPPSAAPEEATSARALASWAHSACRLTDLRGEGVRAVNDWRFAVQALPDGAGDAAWTCDRADSWRGPGRATVQFVPPSTPPSAPGALAGSQSNGASCTRYAPDVMAGVMWRSPASRWYLVAAGTPAVTSLSASGPITSEAHGPLLTAPAPRGSRPTLTARTSSGLTLRPLSGD